MKHYTSDYFPGKKKKQNESLSGDFIFNYNDYFEKTKLSPIVEQYLSEKKSSKKQSKDELNQLFFEYNLNDEKLFTEYFSNKYYNPIKVQKYWLFKQEKSYLKDKLNFYLLKLNNNKEMSIIQKYKLK